MVTIALYCIICEIKRDIVHTLHSTPPLGGPGRDIGIIIGMEKLEWCVEPTVKKIEDMFNRFHITPACDRQTDGQTDRRLATT